MASPAPRLSAVAAAPVARPAEDRRVRAAAAVLAGEPVEAVATRAGTDVAQVLRWADALAAGGAAAVGGVGLDRPAAGPWATSVPVEAFLEVVAHELRTPLTAARAGLKVLADDGVDAAVRAQVSRTVLDRLRDLDRLTLDVLDAVAVATGRSALRPQRVDLAELVADACSGAAVAVSADEPAHVHADPARVRTVVTTLLGHASRYAAPRRTSARVQRVADEVLLTVRLAGVRLSPEQAQAVLEPFGGAAAGDGNGLALYVVRTLVVASGGMVGVAGTGPDRRDAATVLWVRLPAADGCPAVRSLPLPREDPS